MVKAMTVSRLCMIERYQRRRDREREHLVRTRGVESFGMGGDIAVPCRDG